MRFMGVNLWAVLVSALATMVVGFVWYSPLLFARPWTVLMGYDPDDKEKLAEMQKSAGPSYMLSLLASIVSAARPGENYCGLGDERAAAGNARGAGRMAGICHDRAIDELLVHAAAGQAVRNQYGVSVDLFPRDGSDPGDLAVEETGRRLPAS
jgi:hypothetical protein